MHGGAVYEPPHLYPGGFMDAVAGMSFQRLAEVGGISVIIFVIWILTIKFFDRLVIEQKNTFNTIVSGNKEQFQAILTNQKDQFDSYLQEQKRHDQQAFELLKDMVETSEYVAGRMASLESKVDNNLFCPIVRERKSGS
jgi:hypothetical protein